MEPSPWSDGNPAVSVTQGGAAPPLQSPADMRIATGVLAGVFAATTLVGCLSDLVPYRQNANQGDDAGVVGGGGGGGGGGGDPGGGGGGSGGSGGGGGGGGGGGQQDMGAGVNPDLAMHPKPSDGGMPMPDLNDCIPKSATALDGHHNAGADCLTCHNGNVAGANKFYVAGTLFTAVTGGTGVAQATIEITDSAGKKLPLVTANATAIGNFYTEQPVTFPITVRASSCPNTQKMTAAVTGAEGCNSCHNAQMQIHLP